jgi:POT family proton-dependent oligopeptide transporter
MSQTTMTQPAQKAGMFQQLAGFGLPFWMVNIMEMFERLAYYGVRVVIPIYIAQADQIGGLHFSQSDKGWIFFWWALVQSLVPVFSGGFADRYGYKKSIAVSIVIKVIGYLMMATMTAYYPFLFGCCVLAAGTAIFKPGVQGTMARCLNKDNSSVGWGTFYMLVNIGGFLGPPLAHFLYGISWPAVFYGCAVIVSINFLFLLTYKEVSAGGDQSGSVMKIIKITLKNIIQPRLAAFVLIMSGFWLMFMQLFDMLPNFIVDWVDTSNIVAQLGLPSWMTVETARGTMITQEWLINSNGGLIIIAVVLLSWMVSKMRRIHSIFLGIVVASIGLILAGYSMSGYFCIIGILVFTVGEMLASPKMQDYLGIIAPEGEKALYMGYSNIPLAIGWAIGSLMGGKIYGAMGDKANLAIRYLTEQNYFAEPLKGQAILDFKPEAMIRLQEHLGIDAIEATNLLWKTYDPYWLWTPFAAIGIVSAIGIFFYGRWVKDVEKGV